MAEEVVIGVWLSGLATVTKIAASFHWPKVRPKKGEWKQPSQNNGPGRYFPCDLSQISVPSDNS
jgi:hypothetical protein